MACAVGWASAWFVLLAVVIQLALNTKLVYIARHSTRGGRVHRLERSIFWFGSEGPWLVPFTSMLQLQYACMCKTFVKMRLQTPLGSCGDMCRIAESRINVANKILLMV